MTIVKNEKVMLFVVLFSSAIKKKQVLDPDETANQSPDKVAGRIHTSLSDLNCQ